MTVKWSEIEAECGDFRAGFVATFRKYEGVETDERNAHGLPVKVTVKSFAEHMGIPDRTFRRWVSRDSGGSAEREDTEGRIRGAVSRVRNLPPERKAEVIRELAQDLTDEQREDVAFEITSPASQERTRQQFRVEQERAASTPEFAPLLSLLDQMRRHVNEQRAWLGRPRTWNEDTLALCQRELDEYNALWAALSQSDAGVDAELHRMLRGQE